MATAAPPITIETDLPTLGTSAVTSANAVAMMGVINGATIIAPITVAVESAITPPVAISTDSTRSTAKRT
jgi:hypothetical protein